MYKYFDICTNIIIFVLKIQLLKMSKLSQSKQLKYKIKELIEENDMSQHTLAKYLDVSFKTMYNWCNLALYDNSSIPGDQLIRIAFFFERSVEELHNRKQFDTLILDYSS